SPLLQGRALAYAAASDLEIFALRVPRCRRGVGEPVQEGPSPLLKVLEPEVARPQVRDRRSPAVRQAYQDPLELDDAPALILPVEQNIVARTLQSELERLQAIGGRPAPRRTVSHVSSSLAVARFGSLPARQENPSRDGRLSCAQAT